MTTTTTTDEVLAARLLPILRRIEVPVSCVELSRLIHADSSAVFRVLSNHPQVDAMRSKQLTTFAFREGK